MAGHEYENCTLLDGAVEAARVGVMEGGVGARDRARGSSVGGERGEMWSDARRRRRGRGWGGRGGWQVLTGGAGSENGRDYCVC